MLHNKENGKGDSNDQCGEFCPVVYQKLQGYFEHAEHLETPIDLMAKRESEVYLQTRYGAGRKVGVISTSSSLGSLHGLERRGYLTAEDRGVNLKLGKTHGVSCLIQ